MPHRALVLDDTVDPQRLTAEALSAYSHVILLFWAAPETKERLDNLGTARIHALRDLTDSDDRWRRRAMTG